MKRDIVKRLAALMAAGAMLTASAQAAVQEDFYQKLSELTDAQDSSHYFGNITAAIGSDLLLIDGALCELDSAARLMGGRTMLPLLPIVQAAGGSVSFEDGGNTVVISGQYEKNIHCTIGHKTLLIDGQPCALDAPAYRENGVYYLPVRAIAEALGLEVTWRADEQQIAITAPYQTARLLVAAEQLEFESLNPSAALYDGEGLWVLQFGTPDAARAAATALSDQGIPVEPDRYIPPTEMEGGE